MKKEHEHITRIALATLSGEQTDLSPLIEYTRSKNIHPGLYALAWAAILEHEPHRMTGLELAKTLKKITDHEAREGGPYYTDPTDKKLHRDVNSAIGLMLSKLNVELPNLEMYLTEHKNDPLSFLSNEAEFETITNTWLKKKSSNIQESSVAKFNADEKAIIDDIVKIAFERFQSFEPRMRNKALSVIEKTIYSNTDKQMSLMTYYMKKALGERGLSISDSFVARAGLANILFWTAFIIYDDFWDEDDSADPQLLPIANTFARDYISFFTSLFPETSFANVFHTYMDALDEANQWETSLCRAHVQNGILTIPEHIPEYGDYSKKFAPSSGHMFGPLAILIYAGVKQDSDDMRNAITYFKNYLIAMQINDDIHDWVEDLQRGTLSTVVAPILNKYVKKFPEQKEINLEKDKESLEKIFWYEVMPETCKTAINASIESRNALHRISVIVNPKPLETYPNMTESSARYALEEQEKSMEFLQAYK